MLLSVTILQSGSSGNAVLVSAGRTRLLIDIGLSLKQLNLRLNTLGLGPADLDAVLITHEHIDHCRGLPTLAKKHALPVLASAGTWRQLRVPGGFPDSRRIAFVPGQRLRVADVAIYPFALSHDAVMPTGFRIETPDGSFALATDLGHVTEEVRRYLKDVNALVFESNHDEQMLAGGAYPAHLKRRILGQRGHLSNSQSGQALGGLISSATRAVFLAHLSEENNTPELAHETVRRHLLAANLRPGEDFVLALTSRDGMSPPWQLC